MGSFNYQIDDIKSINHICNFMSLLSQDRVEEAHDQNLDLELLVVVVVVVNIQIKKDTLYITVHVIYKRN